MRLIARTAPLAALAAFCLAAPAMAQTPAAPAAAAPAPAPAPADPVLARVNGADVRLSDVEDAMRGLPAQYRNMPPQTLYPALIDQLVSRLAVVALARGQGLDKDPAVRRDMDRAAEEALQEALFRRDIGPQVTDQAVHARYDRDIAGKTGEPEVHASHILVSSEADAAAIIAELKKGGDFAAIAKAKSTDPGATQGGDLGWFKQGDMLPEFAAAAFALQPGQVSDKPVHTQYGWHVIRVEERRTAPPPTFEQARDELRNAMVQENVKKLVAAALAGVKVERFNLDGSPQRATDLAEPPPQPGK